MLKDVVSNNASAFTAERPQSREAWLSSLGVSMSEIDADGVVEAVAPSEANAAWTRAFAVSLAFREGYTPGNDVEDDVQQQLRKRRHIERNRDARQ
jgi:hypothetical protein